MVDLSARRVIVASRLPTVLRRGKQWADLPALVSWIGAAVFLHGSEVAVVEDVGARPGQGVVSMFRFGLVTGMVRGVIAACGIRTLLVSPAAWKSRLNLPADKEACRSAATRWYGTDQWWPRKGDDGVAEAALIARVAE